ncbi:MAG: hypothetical protein HY207_10580 [Nitrospirae bacterium]|nr:hypothetical protein [Nitrospirota bacterium]
MIPMITLLRLRRTLSWGSPRFSCSAPRLRRWIVAAIWLAGLALPAVCAAEDAPAAPLPERVYAAKFDEVWETTLTFLKTRPLPIPVATAEKDPESKDHPKGVISTLPQRYFKIASATFPPRQQDYRDTYTLTLSALPKGPPPPNPPVPGVPPLPADKPVDLTKLQVERKFEKYDKKAKAWVSIDPATEKAGVSVQDMFDGIQLQLTPPPPPPPIEE